jgi:zinc protease
LFPFRLSFFALALAAQAELAVPPLAFTERTLANGLHVVSLEDHAAPVVAIQVWYRVGGKDDPPGKSGFAHLFEHMMFKSTRRMPSESLDRLTEDVGGQNNAYTADDVTVYHEIVPSNHLQRLLWAEAERLSSLTVDARNFTLEREVVKEEYRQTVLAQPFGEFYEFIPKQAFTTHPYRNAVIGDIAQLDASALEEVRSFHATYYRPDNATLVVVGDFDPASLTRWVDEYFAPIAKPVEPIPRVTTKEPARTAARTVRQFDEKVPFPAIAVTYLGPSLTSEDRAAWEVLERVLSGGESSRLYRSLVYEQQLAQSAEFSADLRQDLGHPTFEMVLASGVKVEKARAALLAEVVKLTREPVSERELATAKNQLLAAKLHERETVLGKAEALGRAVVLLGGAETANRELADLQAVTAEKVLAISRTVFSDENQLVIEYLPAAMKPKAK